MQFIQSNCLRPKKFTLVHVTYYTNQRACRVQPLSAELILDYRHGTKKWGVRAHLDPQSGSLPESEEVWTTGPPTGSPPLNKQYLSVLVLPLNASTVSNYCITYIC